MIHHFYHKTVLLTLQFSGSSHLYWDRVNKYPLRFTGPESGNKNIMDPDNPILFLKNAFT